MATGTQVSLAATTATKLAVNTTNYPMYVTIQNSGAALFLGGPAVTNTAFGNNVAASAVFVTTIAPRDTLYGYSVAGATVGVLTSP